MSQPTPHNAWRTFRRAGVTVLGLVALAAPAASAHALAPGPAAGRFLGGYTSQGWAVVAKVSKDEKSLQKVRTGLYLTCTSGEGFPLGAGWARLAVAKGGQVKAAFLIRPRPAPAGSTVSITGGRESISGKLNRSAATFSGVWHLHLNFALSNGRTDSCDSGHVSFTAGL